MPLKLVRRHGSPHWYIRGAIGGVPVDESTRLDKRDEAEAYRARKEWELRQAHAFGRRAVSSFLEAAVSYMEAGGERRFLGPIINRLGTTDLEKIDQRLIDQTARTLYPAGSPGTLNRQVYTPISAVMKHAAKRKLCDAIEVERPKQPKGRVRWLTPDEATRLVDACAPHLKPLVIFLLYTGARMSEALYLDWRDVDLARAHVSFPETKNGEARGVPLHAEAVAALANLELRRGAVFRRPDGKPYAQAEGGGQIKTGFKAACRRAGITDFSPHDCRHTWATWFYAETRDIARLMELAGWKSERMALRYAHVNKANAAASIAALPGLGSGENTGTTLMEKSHKASKSVDRTGG